VTQCRWAVPVRLRNYSRAADRGCRRRAWESRFVHPSTWPAVATHPKMAVQIVGSRRTVDNYVELRKTTCDPWDRWQRPGVLRANLKSPASLCVQPVSCAAPASHGTRYGLQELGTLVQDRHQTLRQDAACAEVLHLGRSVSHTPSTASTAAPDSAF